MFFRRFREKELKMVWEVRKNGRRSYLIGTAHYFPHSFRKSLSQYLGKCRTAIFEGPLDAENMAKVVQAGTVPEDSYHIFNELDKNTINRLTTALAPVCRDHSSFMVFNLRKLSIENPVYEMLKGMKPWLAFFTIWSTYLEQNGWKYSVDMQGYRIAQDLNLEVVFMETIQEQINVLESLSREKIIWFLKNVPHWEFWSQEYIQSYLKGDLGKLKSAGLRFPSRHPSVIDHRDEIFCERLADYLEQGDAAAFVGAPHVRGMCKLLNNSGFEIIGPPIPERI